MGQARSIERPADELSNERWEAAFSQIDVYHQGSVDASGFEQALKRVLTLDAASANHVYGVMNALNQGLRRRRGSGVGGGAGRPAGFALGSKGNDNGGLALEDFVRILSDPRLSAS